jgi:hypothetical protein
MTRLKIRRTVWGWSLYHDGDLVASADCPLELVLLPAVFQMQDNTRPLTRQ